MSATSELLKDIKAGAEAMGIAPTTLCKMAVRHGGLVGRLERGRGVELETAERIRAYIRDNQPPPPAAEAPEREGTEIT
jgi:hypothetical protein